jgi:hypothetical protein
MGSSDARYRMVPIPDSMLPCRLAVSALALVYEAIICTITGICLCDSVRG